MNVTLSITSSGNNTAGETYSLECFTAMPPESINQSSFTWQQLGATNMEIPPSMVNTTGSMSTLTFNTLLTSHAGIYTCRMISMIGDLMRNETQKITITVISTSVHS